MNERAALQGVQRNAALVFTLLHGIKQPRGKIAKRTIQVFRHRVGSQAGQGHNQPVPQDRIFDNAVEPAEFTPFKAGAFRCQTPHKKWIGCARISQRQQRAHPQCFTQPRFHKVEFTDRVASLTR